jgi:hypothetical protein
MFELWSIILASSKQRLQDVTKSVAGAISLVPYSSMYIVFGDTTAAAAAVICFATCSLYLLALCIIIVIIIIVVVVVVVCHGSTTGPWRSTIPSLRRRQAENSQPRPSEIVVVFQFEHDLHH